MYDYVDRAVGEAYAAIAARAAERPHPCRVTWPYPSRRVAGPPGSLTLASSSPSAHARAAATTAAPSSARSGPVNQGATAKLTIVAVLKRAGSEQNTARVISANRDPDLSNNQSRVKIGVTAQRKTPKAPPIVTG